jgi:ankyrin repeat protein
MPSIGDLANVFSRETFSTAGNNGRGEPGGYGTPRPDDEMEEENEAVEMSWNNRGNSRWPSPRRTRSWEGGGASIENSVSVNAGTDSPRHQEQPLRRPPANYKSYQHYHSSWDSDSQFPIREIERIRSKTHRLRSKRTATGSGESGATSQQQQQQQEFASRDWEEDTLDEKVRAFEEEHKKRQRQQQRHSRQHDLPVENGGGTQSSGEAKDEGEPTSSSGSYNTGTASISNGGAPRLARKHHAWSDDAESKLSGSTPESYDGRHGNGNSGTPLYSSSRVAQLATQALLQGFNKPSSSTKLLMGRSKNASNAADTSAETATDDSHDDGTHATSNEQETQRLQLHDLCGEALTTDDVAWNNALHLLSVDPSLAAVEDQGWTPLHICCLASCEPPLFLLRALLYAHPKAARTPDEGGRLPLHLVAASSASVEVMQLLVEAYPPSLTTRDGHGLTPLHLLLRNLNVMLTYDRARILLGLTRPGAVSGATTPANAAEATHPTASAGDNDGFVLQRRRQHLNLSLEQLERLHSKNRSPVVTTFRTLRQHDLDHEAAFTTYKGDGVQACLRRLVQWKRSRVRAITTRDGTVDQEEEDNDEGGEAIEMQLPARTGTNGASEGFPPVSMPDNPAAIPAPKTLHLPLHTLVYRAVVDRAAIERGATASGDVDASKNIDGKTSRSSSSSSDSNDDDEDDEVPSSDREMPQQSVNQPFDVLRLFVACHPEALITRDVHGLTPLLITLVESRDVPTLEIVELLLGKLLPLTYGSGGGIPDWALDVPLHDAVASQRGSIRNPAMVATRETLQFPLHLVAEEMPEDLIRTVFESYPAAREVQDHLGRTPLHVALTSYRGLPVPPSVVSILYTDRVARIRDEQGRLPFDLLLDKAISHSSSLPDMPPRSWNKSSSTGGGAVEGASASDVYQRFLSSSIMGAAKPRTRSEAADFLHRLRQLPPWLRERACSTLLVQDLLVEDLSNPYKCFVVLFEGVLIVVLITVFRLQMEQFVIARDNQEHLSTWYTYAVYATATVRLILELGRWVVSTNLGEFQHLVLFDVTSWINVAALLLVITTSVLLYSSRDEAELYSLGSATTGMLWLSLFGYLSTWWYGASIFFGGLSMVRKDDGGSSFHLIPIYGDDRLTHRLSAVRFLGLAICSFWIADRGVFANVLHSAASQLRRCYRHPSLHCKGRLPGRLHARARRHPRGRLRRNICARDCLGHVAPLLSRFVLCGVIRNVGRCRIST